jgi:hypothetical protein
MNKLTAEVPEAAMDRVMKRLVTSMAARPYNRHHDVFDFSADPALSQPQEDQLHLGQAKNGNPRDSEASDVDSEDGGTLWLLRWSL